MDETSAQRLARHDEAARLMLKGLSMHFVKAVQYGKIEHWRTLGHQVVDLIADGEPTPEVPPDMGVTCPTENTQATSDG